MCTMSIIRTPGEVLRVAFNRDEQDSRPGALPSRVVFAGQRRAMMPVDAPSGGTWIAANDAGVVLAILNVNESAGKGMTGRVSRGEIIPMLIECESAGEAIDTLQEMDLSGFGPFELVAADLDGCDCLCFDGARARHRSMGLGRPVLFTSSGLGDALVAGARQTLFARIMQSGDPCDAQDRFHRHRWIDRPHLSVNMLRPGARTVSHTVVEVRPDQVRMMYESIVHGSRRTTRLNRTAVGAALP